MKERFSVPTGNSSAAMVIKYDWMKYKRKGAWNLYQEREHPKNSRVAGVGGGTQHFLTRTDSGLPPGLIGFLDPCYVPG